MSEPQTPPRRVALLTLGCARNEVDSEELAGRLASEGWQLVDDAAQAEAVVVNTCGFVDSAKKDSIDTILEAADLKGGTGGPKAVVAVGCLAERYGKDLAAELPEADAILGFDSYPDIADRLSRIISGESLHPHTPRDRRMLLPITPADRQAHTGTVVPGHAQSDDESKDVPWNSVRRRLGGGPVASLKLASGCDRRCSFCAIPSFRGSFISRRPSDVLSEAAWLVEQGVREAVLVSENSTSYGKDLGDIRLLDTLIGEFGGTGLARVRVSYLQPAEMRPSLIKAIAGTPVVADYFDLSFQHASGSVLRRMRRFGDKEVFLGLIADIRAAAPLAGIRSNVIVGFPGETEEEYAELESFLEAAGLDAIGVFGYSDEDGTEAQGFEGKLDEMEIRSRVDRMASLADALVAERAAQRIGETVEVLIEAVSADGARGRAAHQGPDDGSTLVRDATGAAVGDVLRTTVVDSDGVDLIAEGTAP